MKKEGFLFLGWKEEGKNEYYDFSTPVTYDLVLKPFYFSTSILDKAKKFYQALKKKNTQK